MTIEEKALELYIEKRIKDLIVEAKVISNEILVLREKCKHRLVVKIAKANTGNWDRGYDSYWYSCNCPICGKRWTEDQ